MCLDTITPRKPKESGTGWKVFEKRKTKLFSDVFGEGVPIPENKWVHEDKYREQYFKHKKFICVYDEGLAGEGVKIFEYPFGWHVFKHKKDAEEWALMGDNMEVRKIKYRRACVQGKQELASVKRDKIMSSIVVAKEIFIIPKKETKGGNDES